MADKAMGSWKQNLLAIVPPYSTIMPPAGIAALLAFLKANHCNDFDFIDFRLWSAARNIPTFSLTGTFGETNVIDVPDLPVVLAVLRAFREGASLTDLLDQRFDSYCISNGLDSDRLRAYLSGMDRFFELASESVGTPRFMGFSVWSSNFLTTLIACVHFKRRNPNVFIVAGGPQVSESQHSAKLGLQSGLFDAVVAGEGEGPLLDLYRSFSERSGNIAKDIPGVMQYDSTAREFILSARHQLKLSDLPMPSFSEMPIRLYQQDSSRIMLPFQLSRGCTDRCSFCSEWGFWKQYRTLESTRVLDQISQLQRDHGSCHINFTDSLLNGHPGRLREFAEGLIQKKIGISWGGFMRANMDAEFARLLKRAGCESVFVGIESMADETLTSMNKRRTKADNICALQAFLDAGIKVVAGLIPGFPGDTRERFLQTIQALRGVQDLYPNTFRLNVEPFSVSPGQPIYKDLERFGLKPQRWSDEVLEIDPYYLNISRDIFCSVSGSNQGADRQGQFQLAKLFSQKRRTAPPDQFDYRVSERFSGHQILFNKIRESWWTCEIATPASSVYRLILNDSERIKINQLIEKIYQGQEPPIGSYIVENPHISAFFDSIELRHIAAPKRDALSLNWSEVSGQWEPNDFIALSPFDIIRELKGEGVVAFVNASGVRFMPAEFTPPSLLRFLKMTRSVAEVKKYRRGQQVEVCLRALKSFGGLVYSNSRSRDCIEEEVREASSAFLPE